MKRLFAFILLLIAASPSLAADSNGYNAQYECRAGGPNCNVDVATLAQQACQQTITTATSPTNSWSAINWSNDVICIEAGDHTGRGTLTLGSSGTSSTRKVLRYVRASDNNDEPWNQSVENRSRLSAIQTNNRSYWIIHRLSLTEQSYTTHITSGGTSQHIIISRILGEGIGSSGPSGDEAIISVDGGSDITIQNSVVRNCQVQANKSHVAIQAGNSTRTHIVNNEVYNCAKGISVWFNAPNDSLVVENNDVYVTSAFYTNCAGVDDPNGQCSKAKALISTSSGGTSSATAANYVHNRVWGIRSCDTSVSCSGGGAPGYAIIGGFDYPSNWILLKNNIIMDSGGGITRSVGSTSSTTNHSIIGNIIYRTRVYNGIKLGGIQFYAASGGNNSNHEIYFNTLIDVQGSGWIESGDVQNSDVRCNVILNSTAATGISSGSGTQADHNVYYGTNGAWTNNTNYSAGDVARPPIETGWAYIATGSGASGASTPDFCQKLGCTVTDGGIIWKAIRAPYIFRHKLRTIAGGEPVVIPYAQAHTSAPEVGGCPSITGSRQGVGINNNPLL